MCIIMGIFSEKHAYNESGKNEFAEFLISFALTGMY